MQVYASESCICDYSSSGLLADVEDDAFDEVGDTPWTVASAIIDSLSQSVMRKLLNHPPLSIADVPAGSPTANTTMEILTYPRAATL